MRTVDGILASVNEDCGDLSLLFPGNPLFRSWKPPGGDKVFVYHITTGDCLDPIASSGLRPRPIAAMSPARQRMEAIFAASAPPSLSRLNSLFAYPDLEHRCLSHHLEAVRHGFMRGLVVLELEVDPLRAIVADTLFWNEAARLLLIETDEASAEAQAPLYWKSRIPLNEYLTLETREREHLIGMPEVLIPMRTAPDEFGIQSVRVRGTLGALPGTPG